MSTKDLDAAGITDPPLRVAYERSRQLHSSHGKTYYLATLLLPRAKRPFVWALYGFARYADEFVDSLTEPDPSGLVRWGDDFLDRLRLDPLAPAGVDPRHDPVGAAMEDTMRRWGIPRAHVEAFLESMRMDITEATYRTYTDLEHYMYGSAAVIGLQMLPILEPSTPEAAPRARALGEAFQMSNFIRDVGEDLTRGRVYLPQEDLELFGVTATDLAAGEVTAPIRRLLQFEIDRTRALYAYAEPGIDMLHPTSRDCMRTAFELYGGILAAVERADYQVLRRRVTVSLPRRLAVAGPGLVRAHAARRRPERHEQPVEEREERDDAPDDGARAEDGRTPGGDEEQAVRTPAPARDA
ncbi:phytoene/squalene synthase family protein [Aquipuribacter sp. SD81]|uniref:phytoene/squalene synthase family protein n=1 Tax=Aquipuribacter sp. SD81 TaxID=3127703 RepID=UPI003019FF63